MADPILQNLDGRPKSSDVYLWCDYIEVRCLAHPDHKFSRGNLLEMVEETAGLTTAGTDLDDEEPDEDNIDDADTESAGELNAGDPMEGRSLTVNDRYEAKVADYFNNLAYRASMFGEAYPFELDASKQELRVRDDINLPLRMLYLQLLLSATLRLVPKARRHELTEPFEALCTKIFSCLMPTGWEVHRFGAKGSTRYRGHLFTRLKKLADDLRGRLEVEKRHFKTNNAGDGGLDIVAWHPLGGDTRVGIPIALAQCGCTAEEWTLKSLEASPSVLGSNLKTQADWATYYFMPQDLVDGQGERQDWQRRPSLTKCIVIDRMRLVRLAGVYDIVAECANAPDQVQEASQLAIA